jgi:non-heme chloroperoxidase
MSDTSFPTTEEQVERANATGRTPVVFIRGLWLLPNS